MLTKKQLTERTERVERNLKARILRNNIAVREWRAKTAEILRRHKTK